MASAVVLDNYPQRFRARAHTKKRSKKPDRESREESDDGVRLLDQPVEALSPPPIHRAVRAASQTTRRVAFEKVGGSAGSGLLSLLLHNNFPRQVQLARSVIAPGNGVSVNHQRHGYGLDGRCGE